MKNPEALMANSLVRTLINVFGFKLSHAIISRCVVPRLIPSPVLRRLLRTVDAYFKKYLPHADIKAGYFIFHFRSKLAEDVILVNFSFKKTVKFIEKEVIVKGKENIEKALIHGRGIILLGAHLGSIMLGTMALMKACFDTPAFANQDIHICTEPDMIRFPGNLRRVKKAVKAYKTNIHFILTSRKRALIADDMIHALKQKNIIFTNMDVVRGGSDRHVFTLFGEAELTLPALCGAVKIASLTGATILPWYNVRDRKGRFILTCEEPVFLSSETSVPYELAEKLCRVLEKWITLYPEQWIYWDRFGKRLVC
jgi:lauroyl/myristoyl acyltransferase